MRELKVSKSGQKTSNWWDMISFFVCLCGSSVLFWRQKKIIIFSRWIHLDAAPLCSWHRCSHCACGSGQQPRSSVAVMPVFDHQLRRSEPHTSQHLVASRSHSTPTCLSLQPAVSFQTPLVTATLQTSTRGWKMEEARGLKKINK